MRQPPACAGGHSLSLKLAGMGQWNVVVATVLGATLGVILLHRNKSALPEKKEEDAA